MCLLFTLAAVAVSAADGDVQQATAEVLAGFEIGPHWGEQVRMYTFDPEVRVYVNAPDPSSLNPEKTAHVVLYALPNGNTIEQTWGRTMIEGLDWHYDIQHIGAQTRLLRRAVPDGNLVVACLETAQKSWPAWRARHEDNGNLIAELIDSVTRPFRSFPAPSVELSSHSGGGSFIFGYLNGVDRIPDSIRRIVFLDSNYGFDTDAGHGDKLIEWLAGNREHRLVVVAYDDRNITLNGKKVVGPTGGTYRATHRMIERFRRDYELSETTRGDLVIYREPARQLEFIIHTNPENAILHTVLVEKNGFIHGHTFGTPYEGSVAEFFAPRAYSSWIQPE